MMEQIQSMIITILIMNCNGGTEHMIEQIQSAIIPILIMNCNGGTDVIEQYKVRILLF